MLLAETMIYTGGSKSNSDNDTRLLQSAPRSILKSPDDDDSQPYPSQTLKIIAPVSVVADLPRTRNGSTSSTLARSSSSSLRGIYIPSSEDADLSPLVDVETYGLQGNSRSFSRHDFTPTVWSGAFRGTDSALATSLRSGSNAMLARMTSVSSAQRHSSGAHTDEDGAQPMPTSMWLRSVYSSHSAASDSGSLSSGSPVRRLSTVMSSFGSPVTIQLTALPAGLSTYPAVNSNFLAQSGGSPNTGNPNTRNLADMYHHAVAQKTRKNGRSLRWRTVLRNSSAGATERELHQTFVPEAADLQRSPGTSHHGSPGEVTFTAGTENAPSVLVGRVRRQNDAGAFARLVDGGKGGSGAAATTTRGTRPLSDKWASVARRSSGARKVSITTPVAGNDDSDGESPFLRFNRISLASLGGSTRRSDHWKSVQLGQSMNASFHPPTLMNLYGSGNSRTLLNSGFFSDRLSDTDDDNDTNEKEEEEEEE